MLIGVIEPQDLKTFDVPPLVIHRDDDQIAPIQAAGLTDTHKEKVNADRLAFAKD